MIKTTKENKTIGKKLKATCLKCKTETNHIVLESVDINWEEILGTVDEWIKITIDRYDYYQIIQCLWCDFISFRHVNYFSELQCWDDNGITEIIYPQRTPNMLITKEFKKIPNIIKKIYERTIEMYNSWYYAQCAEGLRKIVESICIEKDIKWWNVEYIDKNGKKKSSRSKKLIGKIVGLAEMNILTKDNANLLNIQRILGNESLHEMKDPIKEEIKIAIEIIENTLILLYDLPEKAKELNKEN